MSPGGHSGLESGEQRLVGIAEQFGSGAWQWLRSLSASLPATFVRSSCVNYAAFLPACLPAAAAAAAAVAGFVAASNKA